jgi:hypothetical protein
MQHQTFAGDVALRMEAGIICHHGQSFFFVVKKKAKMKIC